MSVAVTLTHGSPSFPVPSLPGVTIPWLNIGMVLTLEQRIRTVELLLADGKMDQLEERLTRLTQEEITSEYQIMEES